MPQLPAPAAASATHEPESASALSAPVARTEALTAFECTVIDIFVRLADMLGAPKSVGEIYGLLFASPVPLAFQDIVERLEISKGSASQGLRFLRAAGAVRLIYVASSRRDHFIPETELRALLAGFVRERILPQLEGGSLRVKSLQEMMRSATVDSGDPGAARVLRQRVEKLNSWHKRGKSLMPLVIKIFG